MSELVSIIIPAHNRAWSLRRTIDSVFQQSYKNFEIIVVDDGSKDGTKKLFSEMKSRKINYYRQRNKGVSAARNRGLTLAQGSLIAFLDSDDVWDTDKLKKQVDFMLKNPKTLILQTNERWIRNGRPVNPKNRHQKPSGLFFDKALKLCLVTTSSILCRKQLFDEVGAFDEALRACEDYDFYLRILAKNIPIELLSECLMTRYGGHHDQLSSAYPAMDRFRIRSLQKLLKEDISPAKQELVKDVLKQKATIMFNGAKKRKKLFSQLKYSQLLKSL